MIRICGQLFTNDKAQVNYALRANIFGIGLTRANQICAHVGIESGTRMKDLTEEQLAQIRSHRLLLSHVQNEAL